jgi:hypothetical protein
MRRAEAAVVEALFVPWMGRGIVRYVEVEWEVVVVLRYS